MGKYSKKSFIDNVSSGSGLLASDLNKYENALSKLYDFLSTKNVTFTKNPNLNKPIYPIFYVTTASCGFVELCCNLMSTRGNITQYSDVLLGSIPLEFAPPSDPIMFATCGYDDNQNRHTATASASIYIDEEGQIVLCKCDGPDTTYNIMCTMIYKYSDF